VDVRLDSLTYVRLESPTYVQARHQEHESMCLSGRRLVAALVVVGISLVAGVPPSRAAAWRLNGRGGDLEAGETPVVVEVRVDMPPGTYNLDLQGQSQPIPAVVFTEGARRWLGTVLPRVPARQEFSWPVKPQPASGAETADGIRFQPQGRNFLITLDRQTLTEYHVDAGHKPFFFPVIGPTGASYTRAYPMVLVPGEKRDHPHQRSFWFTHGSVNGVDFWSEGPRAGTIREVDRKVLVQGPALGRLWTRDEWRAPDDRTVCEDERMVTFYRTKGARIIDFEIAIRSTAGPVTFGDTKEGMFGLRVASSMDVDQPGKKQGGRITNAEGLTDAKAWGQASAWVDYVGPVQGQTVGIAILNHPDSFRYPTTWHVRTYGLFAANPFGWHDFGRSDRGDYTVSAGQSIRFAYRVILHAGDTESTGVPRWFAAYAQPPALEVRAD
jgi:hypothetical protein